MGKLPLLVFTPEELQRGERQENVGEPHTKERTTLFDSFQFSKSIYTVVILLKHCLKGLESCVNFFNIN